MAFSVAASLEFGDKESVTQIFTWASADEDFVYIVVRDREGKEFAAHPPSGSRPSAPERVPLGFVAATTDETLHVIGPVLRDGKITGSIQVGLSTGRISAQYRSRLWTAASFLFDGRWPRFCDHSLHWAADHSADRQLDEDGGGHCQP